MSHTELLNAAVDRAAVTEFSMRDNSQWWVDLLASALERLVVLPFALLIVWGTHRLTLNRWPIATAALATLFALVVLSLTHEFIAPIFVYSAKLLEMIGINRFMYQTWPPIFVCFAGALAFAWDRKRREPFDKSIFE